MGFQPEFSSFGQRGCDLDEARRAIWLWAEPIIIDRAVESYVRLLDEAGTVAVARKHCRLWRAVLFDQDTARAVLDDLRDTVSGLGLPSGHADGSDDVILDELMDIVTSRHGGSRNALRTFSRVLMVATSRLGAARAPA